MREAQDELAFQSHQKLAAAYDEGFFDTLVSPMAGLEKDNVLIIVNCNNKKPT